METQTGKDLCLVTKLEQLPGSAPTPLAHSICPGFSPSAPGGGMSEDLFLLQSLSPWHLIRPPLQIRQMQVIF